MKKFVAFLPAATMLLSGTCLALASGGGMTPGEYTATATGFHGDITLKVTVDAERITGIEIVEQSETEGIGAAALPILIDKVLASQTAAVDSVSAATVTSTAFKAALESALVQAGADMDKMSQPVQASADREEVALDADIVMVGGDAAGLTAVLSALQQGKQVILLEKTSVIGGASAMAGSGTMATGSDWQKEDGYEDSPEKLKADLIANGHGRNHEATVDIYVNSVAESFNWLVSPDGASVPYVRSGKPIRSYSGEGRGAGVTASLAGSFTVGGGTLLTGTAGTELIVEDGVVTGVKAIGEDKAYTISAKAVILATGGFGANDDMISDDYKRFVYAGHAAATGDGLKMAEAVNADLINMEYVNTQPNSMILPSGLGQYCNPGVSGAYSTSGAFLVNQDGVRFANEQGNAWDLMQEMKKNTAQYLVMDQASFDAFNTGMTKSNIYSMEDVEQWLSNDGEGDSFMVKADTLEELGLKLGVAEGALTATAKKFNEDVAKGTEDGFGRTLAAPLVDNGPYYALQMYIRYYATLGGLHINEGMQVLNADLQPVSGLYAAGEVVGGLEGDVYMGATLFGWAVASGYNAGNAAANAVG